MAESSSKFIVVEFAGYVGENDRRSFDTYLEASCWMHAQYPGDQWERLHVDIVMELPNGDRTYDF